MKVQKEIRFIVFFLVILLGISFVSALPVAPTVTTIGNSTKSVGIGELVNYSGNDSVSPDKAGGFIFTMNLDAVSQNNRWKAYVGNVTGTLTLDDADDYTIYSWPVTTGISGEVYATRATSVTWTSIACSSSVNISQEENTTEINHTVNPNDDISTTFNSLNHSTFYVGTTLIGNDTCFMTNLYVNDSAQNLSETDYFEEILLHDGTNLVYAAIIEQDQPGYRGDADNSTYDFQMLLPERGTTGWASSTPYYFYVELT